MKAFEVIGHALEGELYHDGCEPSDASSADMSPVFAGDELDARAYCAACLSAWIRENPGKGPAPLYVYMDEARASEAGESRD